MANIKVARKTSEPERLKGFIEKTKTEDKKQTTLGRFNYKKITDYSEEK
jgi:hypothetical protein